MKCTNCGYENPDTAKFCNECGEKLEPETVCPECGCKNKAGAKFCNECGYRFHKNNAHQTDVSTREQEYKTCSKCGGKNPKGTIMCRSCGEYFPPPPKPLSDYVPIEKPNNENSARKCPNCGYEVGENDICDSCGYDVTQEKNVLSDLVDSEKCEVILGSIDEIEKKKRILSTARTCILVAAAAFVLIISAYGIMHDDPTEPNNDSSQYASTNANSQSTPKPTRTPAPTPAPTIDPAVAQQMAEERAAQEKAAQEAAKANSLGLSLNEFYTSFNSIAATNGLDAFLGKASTIDNVTTYATLDSGVSLDCTVINDYVDSVSIEVQRSTESLIASSYYVASAALAVDSSLSMQEADSVLANLINGASANPGNDYKIVNNGITYIANVYNTFVFFYITK